MGEGSTSKKMAKDTHVVFGSIEANDDVTVDGNVEVRLGSHTIRLQRSLDAADITLAYKVKAPMPWFAGREDYLERIFQFLQSHSLTGTETIPLALIRGDHCIGKSELARKFAQRWHREYYNILWISSSGRTEAVQEFCSLAATKLNLETDFRVTVLDETEVREQKPIKDITRLVYESLLRDFTGTDATRRSLIVFDNVKNVHDITTVLPTMLPSNAARPHIIVTTHLPSDCFSRHSFHIRSFTIDRLTEDEAKQYLASFSGKPRRSNSDQILAACENHPETMHLALCYESSRRMTNPTFDLMKCIEQFKRKNTDHEKADSLLHIPRTYKILFNLALAAIEEIDPEGTALQLLKWSTFTLHESFCKEFAYALNYKDEMTTSSALALLAEYGLLRCDGTMSGFVAQLMRDRMKERNEEASELKKFLSYFRKAISRFITEVSLRNYLLSNAIHVVETTADFWKEAEVLEFVKFFASHLKSFNQAETIRIWYKIREFEIHLPISEETTKTLKLLAYAERDRKNEWECGTLYIQAVLLDLIRCGYDPVKPGMELLQLGKFVLGPHHDTSLMLNETHGWLEMFLRAIDSIEPGGSRGNNQCTIQ